MSRRVQCAQAFEMVSCEEFRRLRFGDRGEAEGTGLQFQIFNEKGVSGVEMGGALPEVLKVLGGPHMIEMGVGMQQRHHLESELCHPGRDAGALPSRVHHHAGPLLGVPKQGAIALQGTHGEGFEFQHSDLPFPCTAWWLNEVMPDMPERLRRAFELPGKWLKAYENQIIAWSGTTWFPGLLKAAFILVTTCFLLAVGAVILVGWMAFFFVFAIPVAVCLPGLIGLHRRQRRECTYSKELRTLEVQAKAGNAQACYELGRRYQRGNWDTPKDYGTSVLWYRQGAELGHAGAMQELGEALAWGQGTVRNTEEAAAWREKAAALGQPKEASEPSGGATR